MPEWFEGATVRQEGPGRQPYECAPGAEQAVVPASVLASAAIGDLWIQSLPEPAP